jgi:CDP-diglyceride synthetase
VSNLTQRLLSAAVLLPGVITAFVWGGWWSRGLVLLAALGGFVEYGRVVLKDDLVARLLLLVVGVGATAAGLMAHDAVVALLAAVSGLAYGAVSALLMTAFALLLAVRAGPPSLGRGVLVLALALV